jgi:hypothetical protein
VGRGGRKRLEARATTLALSRAISLCIDIIIAGVGED